MKKIGVYGAMFDPITLGHWWMIEQGMMLFDHLHVAVAVNPTKTPYFTTEDRCSMIQETLDRFLVPKTSVSIGVVENKYLVDYARSQNATYLLRGIRNQTDYEYERSLRNVNSDIDKGMNTIFLMPPREMAEISSSFVKSLVGIEGWPNVVKRYLPHAAFMRFIRKANDAILGE